MDNDKNCNPAPHWYNTSLSPMDYGELIEQLNSTNSELETLKAKVREFIDKIELEDVTDWKTNDIKNLICDLRELVK